LNLMMEEGIAFRTNANIGVDISVAELKVDFDAVVLAGGSTRPRDLPVPGRDLKGIHFAMDYLTLQNRVNEGERIAEHEFITANDKHVIIIGGGDTGADCLGTAHRQGAASVHQLELLAQPPDTRAPGNPWPLWPNVFRVSSAHEEGGERMYSIATERFTGNDRNQVTTLHAHRVEMVNEGGRVQFKPVPNSEFELKADLVLLAMGFLGPETNGMLDKLGVKMTERGTVWRDERWMTSVPGVFTAGDMQRGQSLIVWAIAEGRSCARGVDEYLMGRTSLPAPLA
jgi:glutamate synthase (NADPH) small chain